MKIGLDTAPAALRGTYFQHLASVLARYAPEHEYIIGAEVNDGVDLYHGFRSSLPLSVHLRRVPSVMTVPNLNFLRYPHLYTFAERLFVLTLYRRARPPRPSLFLFSRLSGGKADASGLRRF